MIIELRITEEDETLTIMEVVDTRLAQRNSNLRAE